MSTQSKTTGKYEIDMISGSLMPKLIRFFVPLMLSGILQLLFNAVDLIVVGKWAGNNALAAVLLSDDSKENESAINSKKGCRLTSFFVC